MKTNLIFLLLGFTILLYSKQTLAQGDTMYPIGEYYVPDVELTSATGTIQGPSNVYLGGSHASNYFKANGSSNITVKGEKVVIRRSLIGGNTQPGFRFAAKPGPPSIASNYSYANGAPQVPLFEKIEFGIKLPTEIQNRINNFLTQNQSAVNHSTDFLNPYDPQDISVEATLTFSKQVANVGSVSVSPVVFGFYYQEFSVAPGSNNYNSITTEYPFRIRIAPTDLGNHSISFVVKYKKLDGTIGQENLASSLLVIDPNTGNITLNTGTLTVEFNAVPNNNTKKYHKGHLEVGHHKRHLRHSYSQTSFFPLGTNNVEWPKDASVHPEYNIGPNHWHGPIGYATRRNEIFGSLVNHQGNFSRIISMGRANAIESTAEGTMVPAVTDPANSNTIISPAYYIPDASQHHLGNYHLNQTHLWETDLDIEQCENLGVFLLFCLQIHYPFMEFDPYGGGVNGLEKWANNCYNLELNLSSPNNLIDVKQFFLNTQARRFFFNKLRYAQARWGYSPAIGIWQITCEIDQYGAIGASDASNNVPEGSRYAATSSQFNIAHVEATQAWNLFMAQFLSNLYPKHLVTTNYISNPFTNNRTPNWGACLDKSYFLSEGLDIISLNTYNYDGIEHYDRGLFAFTNDIIFDEDNYNCIGDNQGYFVDKPLFFTESGNSKLSSDACTDISMHNTSWAALCSGQMGVPLQWHAHGEWNEPYKTDVQDFYSNFVGLGSFVSGLDFETHKYRPSVQNEAHLFHQGGVLGDENNLDNDELNFEVFVMQNDHSGSSESDIAFGWIHNRTSRREWHTSGLTSGLANNYCIPKDPNFIFENSPKSAEKIYWLNQFKTGTYFLDVYDTKTGQLINSYLPSDPETPFVDPVTHNLRLKLPFEDLNPSTPDIAFKLWHSSVNPNELRIIPNQNTSQIIDNPVNSQESNTKFQPNKNQTFFCKISPNPTKDYTSIESNGEIISCLIIKDPSSKIIRETCGIFSNKVTIETLNIASGLYFISIYSNLGNVQTIKFIKQ
jgi:hypothetical protein